MVQRAPVLLLLFCLTLSCGGDDDDKGPSGPPGDPVPAFGTGGVITSNPSGSADMPLAIGVMHDFIFIAGYDSVPSPADTRWRLEKRDLRTGDLDAGFGSSGVVATNPSVGDDRAVALAVDPFFVYVVGHDEAPGPSDGRWRIEKRRVTDGDPDPGFGTVGVITSDPSGRDDRARAIVIDTSHLYAAGFDTSPSPGDTQWRIEKRSLIDGGPDTGFGTAGALTVNPGPLDDQARAIVQSTLFLYVAGSEETAAGDSRWRIEKRAFLDGTLDLGFGSSGLVAMDPSVRADTPHAVAGESSFLYIAGDDLAPGPADSEWRVETVGVANGLPDIGFGSGGSVKADPSAGVDAIQALAYDSPFLFLAGGDASPGDGQWRVEKRKLKDGSLVTNFASGGVITSNPGVLDDQVLAVTTEGSFLILAGSDTSAGDAGWRLEKRYR